MILKLSHLFHKKGKIIQATLSLLRNGELREDHNQCCVLTFSCICSNFDLSQQFNFHSEDLYARSMCCLYDGAVTVGKKEYDLGSIL